MRTLAVDLSNICDFLVAVCDNNQVICNHCGAIIPEENVWIVDTDTPQCPYCKTADDIIGDTREKAEWLRDTVCSRNT